MNTDTWIKRSIELGVLGLTAALISLLALTDIYHGEADLSQEWNALRVCFAIMVASQIIFAINFFGSLFFGPRAGRNPWGANGLEWQAPSPPGHGNFDFQPIVYRGPYEYGSPEVSSDYYPQTQPPPDGKGDQVAVAPAH